ncbi:hypothetical protein BS47DRAFT_1365547 [Hydnum rufescens UP504]|uniref:Uncharacterized protein n=1 Tax=Hydnum rufescens UP504 TaxID=1448309 RepID=A0A9P6ANB1_9AGAM|nr:hypothetical protein BS47DRAFT_1365547 [Hydnum rufescens UP504]
MAGTGIGLTLASLEIQTRFSLPNEHTAISVTMNLFFRTAGGTIGLAQLAAVLESKVRSYINRLIASGAVSPSDGQAIISSLTSLGRGRGAQGIETLPPKLQDIVRAHMDMAPSGPSFLYCRVEGGNAVAAQDVESQATNIG